MAEKRLINLHNDTWPSKSNLRLDELLGTHFSQPLVHVNACLLTKVWLQHSHSNWQLPRPAKNEQNPLPQCHLISPKWEREYQLWPPIPWTWKKSSPLWYSFSPCTVGTTRSTHPSHPSSPIPSWERYICHFIYCCYSCLCVLYWSYLAHVILSASTFLIRNKRSRPSISPKRIGPKDIQEAISLSQCV